MTDRRTFLKFCFTTPFALSYPSLASEPSPEIDVFGRIPGDLYGPDMRPTDLRRPDKDFDGQNYALLLTPARDISRLLRASKSDGVPLRVESSWRSYNRQAKIWNWKMRQYLDQGMEMEEAIDKRLNNSALPGTSRHHWGTEVDLVPDIADVNLSIEMFESDETHIKAFEWLIANAEDYGFALTYTNNPSRPGYEYEPWHYSHTETSQELLRQFLNADLQTRLRDSSVLGNIEITQNPKKLRAFIDEYVLGINPKLIP